MCPKWALADWEMSSSITETTCGQEPLSFGILKDTTHFGPLTGETPLGLKGSWWVVTEAGEQFFHTASGWPDSFDKCSQLGLGTCGPVGDKAQTKLLIFKYSSSPRTGILRVTSVQSCPTLSWKLPPPGNIYKQSKQLALEWSIKTDDVSHLASAPTEG